jgi:hypothetical protein
MHTGWEGPKVLLLLYCVCTAQELFGPLSMRALEEDQYVRQTTGYLPEAEVAFIGACWCVLV